MTSIDGIGPVNARVYVEGQDGPRSAYAQQRNQERGRTAVEFGGAVSQTNAAESRAGQVDPGATSDRARAEEAIRARNQEQLQERREENRTRPEPTQEETASPRSDQGQKKGQLVDVSV